MFELNVYERDRINNLLDAGAGYDVAIDCVIRDRENTRFKEEQGVY